MALAARLQGLELTVFSLPQRPYPNAELLEELGGVYVSSADATLAEVSGQRRPFDLIMDATGFSPIVWEAAEVLGKNGVLVLSSITGSDRKAEINSDRINQSPGWLGKLLATPIRGLENYEQMIRALTEDRDGIKVFVEVNGTG
jgi:hypothetical protein